MTEQKNSNEPPKRSFEDYRHNDRTELIERLRRAAENRRFRSQEEHNFVTRTVLEKCLLDYELNRKLSLKQQLWIHDILHRC